LKLIRGKRKAVKEEASGSMSAQFDYRIPIFEHRGASSGSLPQGLKKLFIELCYEERPQDSIQGRYVVCASGVVLEVKNSLLVS